MRLLRSPILDGKPHGFSTRQGGVSTGRYASLNVSGGWGDAPELVAENRRRVAVDGGFDLERLYTVKQVHGAVCVRVDGLARDEVATMQADALVATTPGVALAVFSADCVPILFSDGKGRVAAAHAGWRGTAARVAAAALDALVAAGARREDVRVALGPSIGPCCFEVGEEVAVIFDRLAPPSVKRDAARPHVDLRAANLAVLEAAGLPRDRVDAAPPCTHCDRDRFYSFRRDGGGIGQMLSFVVAGQVTP